MPERRSTTAIVSSLLLNGMNSETKACIMGKWSLMAEGFLILEKPERSVTTMVYAGKRALFEAGKIIVTYAG